MISPFLKQTVYRIREDDNSPNGGSPKWSNSMNEKNDSMTFCKLRTGKTYTKGYIPSYAAKVGNKIKLPESSKPDEWWEVEAVSNKPVDKKMVRDIQKNSKNHRKATDV